MKLPKGWKCETVGDLCDFSNGHGFGPHNWSKVGLPIIRIQNLNGEADFNYFNGRADADWLVEPGTLLFAWAGTRGVSFGPKIWNGPTGVLNQHIYRVHPRQGINKNWLYLALREVTERIERKAHGFKATLLHVGKKDIIRQVIDVPPLPEQRKIAEVLGAWDDGLENLDALIVAKERRKKGLLQRLLTGKRRVKGFDKSAGKTSRDRFGDYPSDWKRVSLGEVTHEVMTRNANGAALPVLSCTKHQGLVFSEEYFGRRVYSANTIDYRVVKRGEYAYATNHIEEGSIGYQNVCDAGLVSPIYTVFKSTDEVEDRYLYKVLKSVLLVHLYRANTSSSVDRRGGLRYAEFANIHVWLPGKKEQRAIADILDACDEELRLLHAQRAAVERQKRGLMQRLLTGATRVRTENYG
jgi:type I restriction enzyme S subunit